MSDVWLGKDVGAGVIVYFLKLLPPCLLERSEENYDGSHVKWMVWQLQLVSDT